MTKMLAGLTLLVAVASTDASVVRLDESAFTASAGKITFSEFALGQPIRLAIMALLQALQL